MNSKLITFYLFFLTQCQTDPKSEIGLTQMILGLFSPIYILIDFSSASTEIETKYPIATEGDIHRFFQRIAGSAAEDNTLKGALRNLFITDLLNAGLPNSDESRRSWMTYREAI